LVNNFKAGNMKNILFAFFLMIATGQGFAQNYPSFIFAAMISKTR